MGRVIDITYVKNSYNSAKGTVDICGSQILRLESFEYNWDTACLYVYDKDDPDGLPVFVIPLTRLYSVVVREMTKQEEEIFKDEDWY